MLYDSLQSEDAEVRVVSESNRTSKSLLYRLIYNSEADLEVQPRMSLALSLTLSATKPIDSVPGRDFSSDRLKMLGKGK